MPTLTYTPHKQQQSVHIACAKKSENLWTIVCAGRQSGKSKLAKYQTVKWAYENDNALIWYVTPSEGQSRKVYLEMIEILMPMGVITKKLCSKGNIMIELNNKAKIEFKSAAAEDTLRGSSIAFLVLDECAFIKRETIEVILLPSMNVTGKKILVCSTPQGKNYFYELWMRGKNGNPDYKSFKFTSLDNPIANKKTIADAKLTLPEEMFNQEYMAEWTDGAAVFKHISELAVLEPISKPLQNTSYYIGIDIGLINDYTVISVLNDKGQMVWIDRFRGIETPDVIKRIEAANSLFKPKKISIEANNQGLPIIQSLSIQVDSFQTTEDSKSEIINQLMAAFSSREIQILNNEDLKTELTAFIFEYSKSGRVKFHAANGFHDDMVMSLAIAYDQYIKNKRTGGYAIYTQDKAPKTTSMNMGIFFDNGQIKRSRTENDVYDSED